VWTKRLEDAMTNKPINGSDKRQPEHPVDPLFLNRWSPRAMSGEQLSEAELFSLFEAAKWAPSSSNGQPWRFIYARRETPAWNTLFNLLVDFNQAWTKNAAALIVVVSRTVFDDGKPSRTHSFDAGSAWMSLALQAWMKGLVAHGMAGFDYDKAKTELHIPDDYQVEAMIAVGKPGPIDSLPPKLQERETPSPRKKIAEIIFEGTFKA
jgi:nitroreductase